jgi:hypothetical protein
MYDNALPQVYGYRSARKTPCSEDLVGDLSRRAGGEP